MCALLGAPAAVAVVGRPALSAMLLAPKGSSPAWPETVADWAADLDHHRSLAAPAARGGDGLFAAPTAPFLPLA